MTFKKQITKLLMRLRGYAGLSAPLLLHITEDSFSQSHPIAICHFTMTLRKQDAKCDFREI